MFRRIAACGHLRLAGVFTHFASPDDDPAFTGEQRRRFLAALDSSGVARDPGNGLFIHADNSAGLPGTGLSEQHTIEGVGVNAPVRKSSGCAALVIGCALVLFGVAFLEFRSRRISGACRRHQRHQKRPAVQNRAFAPLHRPAAP